MADHAVDFSRKDVEGEWRAPWTDSGKFVAEIDTDDMADAAAAYLRAASEVSKVSDLSRRATELAADAGSVDGDTLVDAEGRIRATDQALGGDDVDNTVRLLIKVINRAVRAEEEVRDRVHGPGQLDDRYKEHLAKARADYRAARGKVDDMNALFGENAGGVPGELSIPVNGFSIVPVARDGRFHLSEDDISEIRGRHFSAAVEDAEKATSDIDDAINSYRGYLASTAAELGPTGFDLTGGPLDVWLSPEMAVWAAEGLRDQFDSREPMDHDLALRYSAGLEAIFRSVYGPGDEPGAARRDLTEAERDYLILLHSTLGKDFAGDLNFDSFSPEAPDPGEQGRRRVVYERLADSVNMLLNPAIGGIDPHDPDSADDVPYLARRFVYNSNPGWLQEPAPALSSDPLEPSEMGLFSDLMASARVAPGDHWGRDLATVAVAAMGPAESPEDARNSMFGRPVQGTVHYTIGDVLHTVSLNKELSAELLADPAFRDSLLSQSVSDDGGPAALVTSGTTVPEGAEPGSKEAKPYEQAARDVVESAGPGVPWWIDGGRESTDGRPMAAALDELRHRVKAY
ncbi:hypothetical protein [Streptomyces sp. NPDC049881]|uniref:hypothetical protein n=1 Tax=Streptomyces sp. NPDC049881 TaxID=3155778 RepID=UPI00342E26C8